MHANHIKNDILLQVLIIMLIKPCLTDIVYADNELAADELNRLNQTLQGHGRDIWTNALAIRRDQNAYCLLTYFLSFNVTMNPL